MKWDMLWSFVCLACFYQGALTNRDFQSFVLVGLLLICILGRWRPRGDLEEQNRAAREPGFWDAFCKEFASSLAKASVSLVAALIGVLILSRTGDAATPSALGGSIGEFILSSFGGP